jgi:hypothetical protein
MSFVSWVALCLASAVFAVSALGCSSKSSSQVGGSGLGESCTDTDDCNSGLVCIQNSCVTKGTTPTMDSGTTMTTTDSGHPEDSSITTTDTGTAATDTGSAPADSTAPPTDTGTTMTMDSGSMVTDTGTLGMIDTGPAPPPGGGASLLDQACQSTADCAAGLVCIPLAGMSGGVCDLASYGITPTGESCSGECLTASDCCELPVGVSLRNTTTNQPVTIHQCNDILDNVLDGTLTSCGEMPAPSSATGIACFYYETYCMCGANTWACTNNLCSYTGACSVDAANELGGCPSLTRTGAALVTSCNTTANVCESTVVAQCMTDADCVDGTAVADTPGATCRDSDCTCFDTSCYLKCAQDIDCRQGFTCDATTKLCETAPACTTNADCAVQLQNVTAVCNQTAGTCGIPCTNDHDCSPSGAIPSLGPFNGTVCGASGVCEPVGCSSSANCPASPDDVSVFCVPAGSGTSANVVESALTN